MSQCKSYRQILRSTSVIGGASVINIVVGLVRTKVAAVLLGPAGIGLIGLLQSLIATASTVSALGSGTVGTRQVAEAAGRGDDTAVAATRRALFWGTLALSVVGAMVFWLLRDLIAVHVLKDASRATDLGWLAIGVALTVASGSQGALLNGLRRIDDLARISIGSVLFSTLLGVGALLIWREDGVLLFMLASPVASFVLGHRYVAKLGRLRGAAAPLGDLFAQWGVMARLGAAFMMSGLVTILGQLLVRILVQHELGTEALGHFQAVSTISITYVGFVLTAMGTDYYPRLTAVIKGHATANRLVNEQVEVALLLAGPIFLAMLGLGPWIIELLYSSEFTGAVSVLRWQVLGDILKVASWPLGFIILAAGDGRTYMVSESLAIAVFAGLTWIGLPLLGIEATGIAFVGMYLVYLPTVFLLARRRTGFAWQRRVYMQMLFVIALALVVFLAAIWSQWLSAGLGVAGMALLSFQGVARLGHMADLGGPVGWISGRSRQVMMKLGVWRE